MSFHSRRHLSIRRHLRVAYDITSLYARVSPPNIWWSASRDEIRHVTRKKCVFSPAIAHPKTALHNCSSSERLPSLSLSIFSHFPRSVRVIPLCRVREAEFFFCFRPAPACSFAQVFFRALSAPSCGDEKIPLVCEKSDGRREYNYGASVYARSTSEIRRTRYTSAPRIYIKSIFALRWQTLESGS